MEGFNNRKYLSFENKSKLNHMILSMFDKLESNTLIFLEKIKDIIEPIQDLSLKDLKIRISKIRYEFYHKKFLTIYL